MDMTREIAEWSLIANIVLFMCVAWLLMAIHMQRRKRIMAEQARLELRQSNYNLRTAALTYEKRIVKMHTSLTRCEKLLENKNE